MPMCRGMREKKPWNCKVSGALQCCTFLGTNYLATNLYFPWVFVLSNTLKTIVEDGDAFISLLAWRFTRNLINILFACILDPRYKIQFCGILFRSGVQTIQQRVCIAVVKAKSFSIYNEYASKSRGGGSWHFGWWKQGCCDELTPP